MTLMRCPHCDMEKAVAHIKGRTVVLFGKSPHDQKNHVAGTAVLFSVADERFLLGAHHVIEFHKLGVPLQIGLLDGSDSIPLIKGVNQVGHSPANDLDPSRDFDIASVRLSKEVADYLKERGMVFMNRSEVGKEDLYHKHSHAAVFGFPDENFKAEEASVKSLTYSGLLYRPEPGHGRPLDTSIHVAMEFPSDPSRNQDDEGNPIVVPSPKGMSGCGMWILHDQPEKGSAWSTDNIKLIGIQHKRLEEGIQVLVGTRIEWLLGGMKKAHPDIKAALELGIVFRK